MPQEDYFLKVGLANSVFTGLSGATALLRHHFPNIELQQKSTIMAQVPKSVDCPTSQPHASFTCLQCTFPCPTFYGLHPRRLSIFAGPILWSLRGFHFMLSGHQCIKMFDFSPACFHTLEWSPYLK